MIYSFAHHTTSLSSLCRPIWKYRTMMTSSNGDIFALLAICAGNSPVPGEFRTKAVTWSFDAFFDLRLNKRLSKQSWGWWFETQPCPLWRHCNVLKCLSGTFCPECVSKAILSIIFHAIYGAVRIQRTHFSYDDFGNMCTLSYYQYQIGSMTHLPLFADGSWNNGMRYVTFYILIKLWSHYHKCFYPSICW